MSESSPPRARAIDVREGYDRWASTYDETENPIVALDDAVLPVLIGPVDGTRVVDAGCGTGRHTAWLARSAAHVWGIDFSSGMLARAREQIDAGAPVELIEHDLAVTPYPLATGCADGALCALVGEHLDDLSALFGEFARIVRPGGWLVFSVYHPFLALLGKEANFTDAQSGVEYRLGATPHLLSSYITALSGAGFTLDLFREFMPDAELCQRMPAADKYRGWPILLVLRGRRSRPG